MGNTQGQYVAIAINLPLCSPSNSPACLKLVIDNRAESECTSMAWSLTSTATEEHLYGFGFML